MTERDAIEQLAALLDGEDVPDAPASLDALTGLATAVRDHAELTAPSAEFRTGLRAELLAAADAPPGLLERARNAISARTARARSSARVAVATMTASSMIGSAGVAVAAQSALPGDALYGLKQATEDARIALAADGVAEARLHLALARERLEELQASAGQLDTDQVVALLARMDAHSEAGAEALLHAVLAGTADAEEVRSFTTMQRSGLVGMFSQLPLLAKPVAEDSLELLRRIELTAARTDAEPDDGMLDDARDAAEAGRAADARTTAIPGDGSLDIPLPGIEAAVPLAVDGDDAASDEDADATASASDDGGSSGSATAPDQDPQRDAGSEDDDEQWTPEDGLAAPTPDDGDERDGDGQLDSSTSLKQLPGDAVKDTTAVLSNDDGSDDLGTLLD